jgi:Fe-S-cluster-containing dehydrogenase component
MEKNKILVADDEPMTCKSCKEMEAPLAQYTVAVDTGKCIGCQMCTMDCAAHHADPKDGPIVYPQSWDLLPEAKLYVDVEGPCLLTCPFAWISMDKEGRATQKCTTCMERFEEGTDPVCVQICPRGALSVKIIPEPIAEARKTTAEMTLKSREERKRLFTLINN